jgi:hypothetical protein
MLVRKCVRKEYQNYHSPENAGSRFGKFSHVNEDFPALTTNLLMIMSSSYSRTMRFVLQEVKYRGVDPNLEKRV